MHFIFAGQALSSADRPTSNVRIAGTRVVDEVDAVLSAAKRYFGRGNRSTPISFDCSAEFASFREAEVYALTLNTQLPEVGTLEVVCGDVGDLQSVFFAGSALQAIASAATGVRVYTSYQLACGLGTTTPIPEIPIAPSTPDPMILRGELSLTSGQSQADITWATQPAAPTTVNVNLVFPDSAGSIIPVAEQADQRTASGTRFVLASATPASGYRLSWAAIF